MKATLPPKGALAAQRWRAQGERKLSYFLCACHARRCLWFTKRFKGQSNFHGKGTSFSSKGMNLFGRIIISTETLGFLPSEYCFVHQWKMWSKSGQKGSGWTRGQHMRMENFQVSSLSRACFSVPDGGKTKLIVFENLNNAPPKT